MYSRFTLESTVKLSSLTQMSAMVKSPEVYHDLEFMENNKHIANTWKRIGDVYPEGASEPLLPETFSRDQFGQGNHYECFMLSALSTLIRFPDVIRHCFVTTEVQPDGHYTFQFFRDKEWVKVEIDDYIAMESGETLYIRSPTRLWWPLLLEKAYAKFYTAYDHLEGCTLQEAYHDLTGNPVLNIPTDARLAKAAFADVSYGSYWLDLAERVQSGRVALSALTRDLDVESMGLQREQQYGILSVFSLFGTSHADDIVIQLHNPFEDEEYTYTGPLNRRDTAWTAKLRSKYNVDDERSIFMPLRTLLKVMSCIQLCYLTNLEETFVAFDDEWKGPTAGGNPTMVTWRSNPLYLVRNNSTEEQQLVVTIAQRDQREHLLPEESPSYAQCGLVLCQCSAPRPMPTFWVTGNNHRHLFKSLFLNSREVTNRVTVPPNSLCYLVASCLTKGTEAPFRLEVRRKQDPLRPNRSVLNAGVEDGLTVEKLEVPSMDWEHPIVEEVEMQMRTKDRIDFFVEHPTDVHVLLHQNKPYFSKKTGGDAMAQDYVGVHLYDDTDHRITGVHAATNFRETSLLYSLPRSGRYALSITCPRGKGNIPVTVTVVTAPQSGARRVDAPAGASTLEDADDAIEDNEGPRTDKKEANPIDMLPVVFHEDPITETPDSNTPFEDNRFMSLNRAVTTDPWVHIGDLYPVGKTLPLLPEVLSREQFQRGTSQECACLTAFAVLVEHHPDVIRHCFVSQQPRKDGRYVFRFHRYGRWVSVEIDDRIPQMGGRTVFCESPTEHWWPLLLEKAYAKFYSMYHNLEGCTMDEIFHDFTGRPVLAIPTKTVVASFASRMDVQQPQFWLDLGRSLEGDVVASAVSRSYKVKRMGIWGDRYYGVLGCFPLTASPSSISDIVVKLFNPYGDAPYEGPMDQNDPRWTPELRARYTPEVTNLIYMPVDTFCDVFVNMQQAYVGAKALVTPSLHFHSEWAAGTNGGNPNLLSWRDNPLYVVRNTSNVPVDILAMIRQEDQRHVAHTLPDHQPNYIYCGLTLSKSDASAVVPTYLVTGNNHAATHKGLFLNSREVSNAMTIPPKSLCYLVPSAMYHEMSPFILSYWLRRPEDEGRITMERLDPHVARRLPAVEHFSLSEGQKHEVHFHVDVATDAHVLLTLLRQSSKAGASEITGDDCVSLGVLKTKGPDGIALRLAGSLPSNFKESGHAIHLTEPGTYVVVIQCTKCDPAGELPCRVEVVCTEEAHVRLVDAEEHSPPHVEAVVEAPVAEDQLVSPPRAAPVEEAPREVSPIGDVPFLHDEYRAIPTAELNLMDHPDFAEKYNERARLLQSAEPSVNASRVSDLEDAMHNQADAVATAMHENERAVLDPTPEGIPLELLPLDEDPVFRELEEKRRARRASVENGAPVLPAVEQEEVRQMNLRAHELARSLKAEERELFLHPVALGVPCSELPLDEDPTFSKKEVERIWLRRRTPKPEPSEDTEEKINALNDALNQRAEDLAKTILESERPTFLDAEHLHVRNEELPLSEDRPFVLAEAQRHELLLRTLKANDEDAESQEQQEEDLHRLDAQLNGMAEAMAADFLAKQRPHYLATEYGGHLTSDLPLNNHDEFLLHEQEYRDLQKGTIVVGEESRAVQAQLQREAAAIAKEVTREDRPHFLKASYHGVPLEELPLDANEKIAALESRRAQLLREPARNHVELQTVERKIESCVEQLAKNHAMKDVSFLEPYPDGVPIALVPLSEDAEFSRMASQRVALRDMSDVGTEELEHKMNARAVELAHAYKDQQRRTYYTVGLPIESLPLDSDDIFAPLERQRFDRMATHYVGRHGNHPRGNDICRMEEQLQARAEELNRMARDNLCRSFLDPTPLSIPLAEIPLDTDPSFVALEKELYATASSRSPLTAEEKAEAVSTLQHAMQRRVYELAAEELERRMPFIDAEPEGVPLSYLTVLGTDAPFASLSARYKVTRQPSLQESLNKRVHELAKHQKEVEREEFLASSPDGVPVEQLHLDEDADFARWEQERRALKESADANDEATKDRIREIERLMNERAMKLAREQKWRDRERIVGGCVPPQVLLRALPFDETPDFIHAENTRYDLLSTVSRPPSSRGPTPRNAPEISEAMHARIHPMEETMQSIARDLAQNALWDDRDSYLDPEPEDIPIREVPLDEDADFVRQEVKRHSLLFPANPATTPLTRDDMVIKRLEQELNDRAHELAREMKLKHREQVIGTRPDGVPLNDVPLDGDAEFTELEKELWHLKSTPRSEREVEVAPWLKPEYHGVVQGDLSFVKTDPVLQRLAQELFVMGAPHDAPAGTEAAPLQVQLHDRVGVLTLAQLKAERDAFLPSTIRGVAREELPLNHDVIVVPLEHKLRVVKGETAPDIPDAPRSQVERKLESEIAQRVDQIALVHTFTRLDFLPSCPEGIPLRCLPIHSDPAFVRMEGQAQRWLQTAPKEEEVEALRNAMVQRVHELAMDAVHAERRRYLDYPRLGYTTPEEVDAFPHGCLDEDAPYRARERQWYGQVCRPKQHQVDVPQQEQALNDQAEELLRDAGLLHQAPPVLAQEDAGAAVAPEPEEPMISEDAAAAAHPSEDEADEEEQEQQEEDEGDDEEAELPNEEMPPQEEEEPRDVFPAPVEADREGSMPPNWGDAAFHAANRHVASLWPRLPELYPEGVGLPLLPRKPHSSEVRSAPDDVSYMAPFIAALGRYPVLLERLIATPQELDGVNDNRSPVRGSAQQEMYTFKFFDPNSRPIFVEVDDRVPCTEQREPMFTLSPRHQWYPLLLEKAYAKFVGGYERLDDCTSHETLRDLTGRPVTHLPLDTKLSRDVHHCDCHDILFWRGLGKQVKEGDAVIATSNDVVPDGLHPNSYYAVFDVLELVPGSTKVSDVVIKILNTFPGGTPYDGPLHAGDPHWTDELHRACRTNFADEPDFLYIPQAVFIRNFASLQHCHVQCGDRLTVLGEWDRLSAGSNPKYTTFRQNPVFLVENKSSQPVSLLAELRHRAPVFYDANHVGVYHDTALALLRTAPNVSVVAPLLTYNTHQFIHKGLLTDAREVCSEMELPPRSACYLVPYSRKRKCYGKFQLSVYPKDEPVEFTPLIPLSTTHRSIVAEVVALPGTGQGTRVDFAISNPCDVHILLHQDKITDPASVKNGDYLAEDEVMMAVYENNTVLLTTTGEASNAREHALSFQAERQGRYTVLVGCPSAARTGDCPCTLTVFTPLDVASKFLAIPEEKPSRFSPRRPPGSAPPRPQSTPNAQGESASRQSRPSGSRRASHQQ